MKISKLSRLLSQQNELSGPGVGRLLSSAGGMVAAIVGCIYALGWILGLPRFQGCGPCRLAMAPCTAVFFLVYGVAMLHLPGAEQSRKARSVLRGTFIASGIMATAVLVYSLSISIPLLPVAFDSPKQLRLPFPAMSPITACSFVLVSLSASLLLAVAQTQKAKRVSWHIALLLLGLHLALGIGYLYDSYLFYLGSCLSPAATSNVAFIALALTLASLSRPQPVPDGVTPGRWRYPARLLVLLFVLLAVAIVSAGYLYHSYRQQEELAQAEQQLSAVADLKLSELMLWREERLGDGAIFHQTPPFAKLVRHFFATPKDQRARDEIGSWINRIHENRNYESIFLLDASGTCRLTFPVGGNADLCNGLQRAAREALQCDRVILTDFYRHRKVGKIYLAMLVPILQGKKPVGTLVIRIDPDKYLYPFLSRWPSASRSAEAVLVRREGGGALLLTNDRSVPDTALKLRVPSSRRDSPAIQAISGATGVVGGKVRGKPVLAAIRKIPDSTWFLITHMDKEEIYAPIRERLWSTVLLITFLLLSSATGIGYLWRRQSAQFFQEQYEAEVERLKERRLAEEQERLSKARLKSLLKVLQYEAKDENDLLEFALEQAVGITASRYGHIYLYHEEEQRLSLHSWSSRAVEESRIKGPWLVRHLDQVGVWGDSIRQRKPVIINDYPAGHPPPGFPEDHLPIQRFLSLPLFEKGRIVAVIGIANKESDYGDGEVVQLSLLMDAVWKMMHRKRAEEALLESRVSLLRAEEISRLNRELEQRVKERTVELEASNRELEAFCYAVAHDLSTPLRSMSGFSEILLEEYGTVLDPTGQGYLERISSGAGRMGQLINDLLNLSRVTRTKLVRQWVNLTDVAREIVEGLAEQEPERVVEVMVAEGLHADADPLLAKLVLENLIGNAWKYTSREARGRIVFASRMTDGETLYLVQDNGIGFDMAYAGKIFAPFERLHGAGEFNGTGVGLATVQRIVARHGGRVWAEGVVDQGATFHFTLG